MTRDYFMYEVLSELRLTRPELRELFRCSRKHYDATCRDISRPGPKSFLYGWQWGFNPDLPDFNPDLDDTAPDLDDTAACKLSMREIDLLVKVTENPTTELAARLHLQLKGLFFEARDAYRKVNAHLVDDTDPTMPGRTV